MNTFENFDKNGKLLLADNTVVNFNELKWNQHPTFKGVALKHLVTSKKTGGRFSYHLVKIDPNCKIEEHCHPIQLETHEVIGGSGVCYNQGTKINYKSGVISILEANTPHEVEASEQGLYLLAKFIPALV